MLVYSAAAVAGKAGEDQCHVPFPAFFSTWLGSKGCVEDPPSTVYAHMASPLRGTTCHAEGETAGKVESADLAT